MDCGDRRVGGRMVNGAPSHTVVTKLLELARHDPKYLEDLEKCRRAIAVMFTDIRGSTAYFEKYGDVAGLLLVHECNSMVRSVVEKHSGRVIKTIGDGTMSTFEDCTQAAAAAIEMQRTLRDMNKLRKPEEQAAIRIGLHFGNGIVKSNDVFGDVVNVASRVESVAVPGQIVISEQLQRHIHARGFRIVELGHFSLKGKNAEQVLFQVLWRDEPEGTHVVSAQAAVLNVAGKEEPGCQYKLQVIKKDGSLGAEYLLKSTLTIGRSQGDIRFPSDPNMAALHARIALEQGQVFVEDLSQGGESVFVRLSAAYTLQNGDIIMMGNAAFHFRENSAVMSAATMMGATLADINALNESVAEFVRLDAAGNAAQRYPLRRETVEFGRTQGTYTFPEDKLMSRIHARVLQRGEDFVIEDAASRNGSFIKVRGKAPVPVGSSVLVGSRLLKLVDRS